MDETVTTPVRQVHLPDGRDLVVRPATTTDIGGLIALDDDLDEESRYRRYFSVYHPGARYFARLVAAPDRGGACLVAVATGPHGPDQILGEDQIVGEAGYEPLPDGNGELAITVHHSWRGWLGPYLFDALLDHAASHGVPNLEADVLVTNRPMLALVRARRYAAMPRTDWTVMRVVVGAAGPLPDWPPHRSGPRVLLEGVGGRWPAETDAEAAGLDVLACPGPGRCQRPCPALEGEPCPLVEGADVIVMASAAADEDWDEIRASHRRLHPETPVIVEGPRPHVGVDLVRTVQRRLRESDD